MSERIKPTISGSAETMLQSFYARAQYSKSKHNKFYDAKAVELVDKIDYDFSTAARDSTMGKGVIARTVVFDELVKNFIEKNPDCTVVNIACGLDTRFYRMDNGKITWYNLDLPETIAIRNQIFEESGRVSTIGISALDPAWSKEVKVRGKMLFIIEGLSMYLTAEENGKILKIIKDNFDNACILMECLAKSENGTSANISTVLANGYGTDDVDARFEKNFYAGIVEVDGKPVMMDNGQQLEYFPLELKLNLTGSSYVKTAGARMAKYEVDRTSHSDGRQPDNDIVLFRYADALLMKSEAKVRNGEDGSLELNEVRGRVGMPYREATLENILKERLLELVWEGWRRQDMVRFGVYHKSYDQRVQLADEKNGYTTVFPIPQKSIDLNPKLKQNVGYK